MVNHKGSYPTITAEISCVCGDMQTRPCILETAEDRKEG